MNIFIVTYGQDHTDHGKKARVFESMVSVEAFDKALIKNTVKNWEDRFKARDIAWYKIVVLENNTPTIWEDYHPLKKPIVLNPSAQKLKSKINKLAMPINEANWPDIA